MGSAPSSPSPTPPADQQPTSTQSQIAASSTPSLSLSPSSDSPTIQPPDPPPTPEHLRPVYKHRYSSSGTPIISTAFPIRSTQRPFPLNASQESEVRDLYYKRVRDACAPEIRDFAHCCAGRTFSISWACRQQRKGMERCMVGRATREEEDRAREEWFRRIPERKREREELEGWKEGQRKLKREWWREWEEGKRGRVEEGS